MTTTHLIHRAVLHQQLTAVVRRTIEAARVEHWLPLAYTAIEQYLAEVGVAVSGPPFARFEYRDPDDYHDADDRAGKVTVEAGVPVSRAVTGDGYVMPGTLPHGPVGIAVHAGAREHIEGTYVAIRDWLTLHGYAQDGPAWEIYLTDPRTHPDPATWRTEVVVPYRAM